jgi:hypothetical protein
MFTYTQLVDDTPQARRPVRSDMPGGIPDDGVCAASAQPVMCQLLSDWNTSDWNKNRNWNADCAHSTSIKCVRVALIPHSAQAMFMSAASPNVIEINMHNLARWLDGVFDNNLLLGTTATSANIAAPDGYTIYVSDRRGDDVKSMTGYGTTFQCHERHGGQRRHLRSQRTLDAGRGSFSKRAF